MASLSNKKAHKSQTPESEFKPCEIMLIMKIESLEEFAKIKTFFENLGKDFKQVYRGMIREA